MRRRDTSLLISESQDITLARRANGVVNGVDLNYLGYDIDELSSVLVLEGTEALKNRVLFWFLTKPGDFVREPNKGGPLYDLLGRPFSESERENIELTIKTKFSESFESSDLELTTLTVTPEPTSRKWQIQMIVTDLVERDLFTISLGVDAQ